MASRVVDAPQIEYLVHNPRCRFVGGNLEEPGPQVLSEFRKRPSGNGFRLLASPFAHAREPASHLNHGSSRCRGCNSGDGGGNRSELTSFAVLQPVNEPLDERRMQKAGVEVGELLPPFLR